MAFFDNLLKSMKYNDEDYEDEYFDEEDEDLDQSVLARRSMKSATMEDEDDSRSFGRASN